MNTFCADDFLGATLIRNESKNHRISVVEYTKNVSEEWHWHDKFHISFILQGGNLETRAKEDVQVTPGKVMIYNEGETHRNRFTLHPSRNLNIELSEDFFSDHLNKSNLKASIIEVELYHIYFELLYNDNYSLESLECLLKGLFCSVDKMKHKNWFSKLETILSDQWNRFPSLYDLSAELNIHPVTISKTFLKYNGITLSEYMRKMKVKRSVNMLLNTNSSLSEIAYACGFSDQSHMTRLVRHYTGYTPGTIQRLR
jgi:AraC family transcriptional regulator